MLHSSSQTPHSKHSPHSVEQLTQLSSQSLHNIVQFSHFSHVPHMSVQLLQPRPQCSHITVQSSQRPHPLHISLVQLAQLVPQSRQTTEQSLHLLLPHPLHVSEHLPQALSQSLHIHSLHTGQAIQDPHQPSGVIIQGKHNIAPQQLIGACNQEAQPHASHSSPAAAVSTTGINAGAIATAPGQGQSTQSHSSQLQTPLWAQPQSALPAPGLAWPAQQPAWAPSLQGQSAQSHSSQLQTPPSAQAQSALPAPGLAWPAQQPA